MYYPFINSLSTLPLLINGKSRSISMENQNGAKGAGGMATGKLGPSRKGCPAIRGLKAGETRILADIEGAGIINHIWITINDKSEAGYFILSDVVLRMYWDGENSPSVECPLGDFFCNGFSDFCIVNSLPIVVNPVRGFNSYFQMPFKKRARITVENQHDGEVPSFFFQINYTLFDSLPEEELYFHAQWRRQRQTELKKDYVILDGIKGKGHYIGTYMALTTLERYWYGEGELKFYIDGDDEFPTICGTGLEDYFGGGFGFVINQCEETPAVETLYQTPFLGFCYFSNHEKNHSWRFDGSCPPMRGFYRWHILDPIRFDEDLRITVQQIGTSNRGLFERQDDVATVSYWYQTEPHSAFPTLPEKEYRWPR